MKQGGRRPYTMCDLFAGIGGIRLGFEQTERVQSIFSCEIDDHACKTYEHNHGDNPKGDITQLSGAEVPDVDIVAGGFPCQAFSQAGRKLGFKDTRGTLFFHLARIIRDKRPKALFLENVKGLVRHDRGRTLETILAVLEEELGYQVHWDVINAARFGVPQKRERIYIVGFDFEADFSFPSGQEPSTTVGDILESEPVNPKYFVSERYWRTLERHRERHAKKGNGFGYQIVSPDELANTLVVGGMGRERNLVVDHRGPCEESVKKTLNAHNIRMMTPREWARLQGFPDSFEFPVADTHAYKQLGNAVAVPVIRAIAERMIEQLDRHYGREGERAKS